MKIILDYRRWNSEENFTTSKSIPVARIKELPKPNVPSKAYVFKITQCGCFNTYEFVSNKFSVSLTSSDFASYCMDADGKKFDCYWEKYDGYYYLFVYPCFNKQYIILDIEQYYAGGINFFEPIENAQCGSKTGYAFYRGSMNGELYEICNHYIFGKVATTSSANTGDLTAWRFGKIIKANPTSHMQGASLVVNITCLSDSNTVYGTVLIFISVIKNIPYCYLLTLAKSELFNKENINCYILQNESNYDLYINCNSNITHNKKFVINVQSCANFTSGNRYELYDMSSWIQAPDFTDAKAILFN